jgi:diaminohydroxyphosphoribosylaminopyrimidine deaminase / 5-amino-6-(5-phosphoribosylamino)uracil reductase
MILSPFFFTLGFCKKDSINSLVNNDDRFFLSALTNAQFCMGNTHPNPAAGAVLVKNNQIIAHGFTHPPGGMHAEKHAIFMAKEDTFGATLYVTLEPCSHYGRTSPCTSAIIKAGIKRVVYGVNDPNPLVDGKGIDALKKAGIITTTIKNSKLKQMALLSILPFKSWVIRRRPYIVIKIATSANDKFSSGKNTCTKITCSQSDLVIHQLRRAIDGVMIGANTARIDDPKLTARLGKINHNTQPIRLVISSDLNLDENLNIFDISLAKTIVITKYNAAPVKKEILQNRGVEIVECDYIDRRIDLKAMSQLIASKGITSVLVEAGVTLFTTMLSQQIPEEVWWFKSKLNFSKDGIGILHMKKFLTERFYQMVYTQKIGQDELMIFQKNSLAC